MNTLKTICITAILTLCYLAVYSQSGTLHQMNQYEGSDSALKAMITEYQLDKDYTFGVWLPIGNCPRCEGAIKPFYEQLSQSFPNQNLVLFFLYPKKQVAIDFIENSDYGFKNTIYLKPNTVSHIFHFSSGNNAQVPYLFILDNASGKLIKSAATLGLAYNETFFNEFTDITNDAYKIKNMVALKEETLSCKKPFVDIKADIAVNKGNIKVTKSNFLSKYKLFYIDESKQRISSIINYGLSQDGNNLIISDHLTDKIFLYSIEDSLFHFQQVVKISKELEHSFISDDIPQEVVNQLESMNVLHSMYLNSFLDNDILYITASFPNLYWEDKPAEEIGYANNAVVITGTLSKNLHDLKVVELNTDTTRVKYSHTKIFTSNLSDYYIFPLYKGWPVSGTEPAPPTEEDNPFISSFYDNTQALALFNKSGKFHSMVGQLPLWHKQNLTGYFYYSPIVKFSNPEQIILCDALIGQFYSIDLKDNKSELIIDVFNVKSNSEELNLELYPTPLQYIKEQQKYLKNKVEDFLIAENKLYVVVSSGDNLSMLKYNLETKSLEGDYTMCNGYEGFNISMPKLLNHNGEIKIIGIGLNDSDQQAIITINTDITYKTEK